MAVITVKDKNAVVIPASVMRKARIKEAIAWMQVWSVARSPLLQNLP
jgi:hypothetical protein